jgi:Uma2 family endonuclease
MNMSLLDKPQIREWLLPISVEQYHQLSEAGIISQNTELVRGVILKKMTKSPLHTYTVHVILQWLAAVLPAGVYVRKEEPLTLADSEPEPDLAVVRGSANNYRTGHPRTAHLVIEVAVASLDLDREKAAIYAGASIDEYWIVIPERQQLEIYRQPSPTGYRTRQIAGASDGTFELASFPGVLVDPRSLLSTASSG